VATNCLQIVRNTQSIVLATIPAPKQTAQPISNSLRFGQVAPDVDSNLQNFHTQICTRNLQAWHTRLTDALGKRSLFFRQSFDWRLLTEHAASPDIHRALVPEKSKQEFEDVFRDRRGRTAVVCWNVSRQAAARPEFLRETQLDPPIA